MSFTLSGTNIFNTGTTASIYDTTGIVISNSTIQNIETPSGSKLSFRSSTKDIHPKLYFSFLKTRFTKVEQEEIKRRCKVLNKLYADAIAVEQVGLQKELILQMAILLRRQEAASRGYDKLIEKADINKFKDKVRGNSVRLEKLENFVRVIPPDVADIIKQVKQLKLFDQLWILYYDSVQKPDKSLKDKVIEKDPILFGTYHYTPDTFAFIVDWIDEHCDLNLESFSKELTQVVGKSEEHYYPEIVKPLDEKMMEDIKAKALEDWELLKSANPRTYLGNAQEASEVKVIPVKEGWPSRLKKFFWRY